ncbi:phage tail tube protein [Anaerotignum lactatifermentans]|uniref:Phage tail tube protein n=1 Tax=Anaerotignum lactatifermentans TaxID=160404 RepID=A0ABS2G8P4_9FIRM|nr:phage tail tube protein [Anaerotignum lactatifermentans]MBM6828763.1 phage tail tube protein [Anaerotignum lactatifermentans]MBM6877090.1 phage tail tube protein [Anaerotignum lactatifermentans]MBM6950345.1 phage tail tube protein [Anaerotignum lactatifermentans]
MGYLRAKDTVNGALGTCFAIIDGKRYELMQVKNVTASVKKTKTEIPILGMTGKQQKSGGWEGSGKMTAYYVSSLFRELMLKYMKDGVDTYFELMITNEDPSGATGKQTVLLKDVNIDEMVISKLDVNQAAMDEEISFTFGDVDLLDKFAELS